MYFYEGRTCYLNKKNWATVEKNEVELSEIKTLISMFNNIKKTFKVHSYNTLKVFLFYKNNFDFSRSALNFLERDFK